MPELPEVEVVKRSLKRKILNLIIKKVKINDGNLRYKIDKEEIYKLEGQKIKRIERRSKFLIFEIGKIYLMLVHLGMTGKFFFIDQKKKNIKQVFIISLTTRKTKSMIALFSLLIENNRLYIMI